MADLDQFFVDELDATLTRDLQKLDLGLNQQIKGHFGHEQTWSGTGRVANGCADIQGSQVRRGVDRLERAAKD